MALWVTINLPLPPNISSICQCWQADSPIWWIPSPPLHWLQFMNGSLCKISILLFRFKVYGNVCSRWRKLVVADLKVWFCGFFKFERVYIFLGIETNNYFAFWPKKKFHFLMNNYTLFFNHFSCPLKVIYEEIQFLLWLTSQGGSLGDIDGEGKIPLP